MQPGIIEEVDVMTVARDFMLDCSALEDSPNLMTTLSIYPCRPPA